MPRKAKHIILDCDGVLVDSEPISVAVLCEAVRRAGADVSEDDAYRLFLGRSMTAVESLLRERHKLALTHGQIESIRQETFRQFRARLGPVPHAGEMLERLEVPRCVASSSSLERIRLSLSLAGLLEKLEPHIYSASMVERGKPAPDLFLHAARDMGARPEDCIVVEDSPAGMEAAKRAGMRVFGFAGGAHAARAGLASRLAALDPDAIFSDMAFLPDLIHRAET